MREIEDVKHDTREAEDVLDVAVAIAEADGEIEPEERKVLGRDCWCSWPATGEPPVTVKLRLAAVALLLFLVVMVIHQQDHVGAGGWSAGGRYCGGAFSFGEKGHAR